MCVITYHHFECITYCIFTIKLEKRMFFQIGKKSTCKWTCTHSSIPCCSKVNCKFKLNGYRVFHCMWPIPFCGTFQIISVFTIINNDSQNTCIKVFTRVHAWNLKHICSLAWRNEEHTDFMKNYADIKRIRKLSIHWRHSKGSAGITGNCRYPSFTVVRVVNRTFSFVILMHVYFI